MSTLVTPTEISAAVRDLYLHQRGPTKLLQVYRPFICPFETLLSHVPHETEVLDVGCGGGLFLGLLSYSGKLARGVGFDANSPVIEIAKKMAEGRKELAFQHLPVEAPWPEGVFDVVSMIDVMHHIPPAIQPSIFALAAERVRPGGIFLYKDINALDRPRAFANRLHDAALAQDRVHYLHEDAVRQHAQDAGFVEEHHEIINRLWYGHALHILRKPA